MISRSVSVSPSRNNKITIPFELMILLLRIYPKDIVRDVLRLATKIFIMMECFVGKNIY